MRYTKLPDGSFEHNVRLDKPHQALKLRGSKPELARQFKKLRALFPPGISVKHGLSQALQYLFEHGLEGLPQKEHILTEAFNAQTKRTYHADEPTAPILSHEVVRRVMLDLLTPRAAPSVLP